MTIQEYMAPARFPETTQGNLDPKGQLLIDAVNYDALRRFLEDGGEPSDSQRERWTELQEKMKHHAALAAEVAKGEAAEKARKGKG
jgi:hypothetical protein